MEVLPVMIKLYESALKGIQALARDNHPNEIVVLLRGKRESDDLIITEYLIPPFGFGTRGSASFPSHMLPLDLTLIGTAHSHPSGRVTPSVGDFHNFYGRVMMIVGPPYDKRNMAVYNKKGESLRVEIASGC
jgi:proteasome lid subunit RPN8/RPN11